jgi:hypothetical protein
MMQGARMPILFLDVDGVVVVLGDRASEPTREMVLGEFPVSIPERAGVRLRTLHRAFQIMFATSWLGDASRHIAPALGLPDDLPHLPLDPDREWQPGHNWKLPWIRRFASRRACAWADDEIGPDVWAWARARDEPTLIVHTDPRVGLTDEHVADLIAFAEAITDDR